MSAGESFETQSARQIAEAQRREIVNRIGWKLEISGSWSADIEAQFQRWEAKEVAFFRSWLFEWHVQGVDAHRLLAEIFAPVFATHQEMETAPILYAGIEALCELDPRDIRTI